jgi:hypothetical protein
MVNDKLSLKRPVDTTTCDIKLIIAHMVRGYAEQSRKTARWRSGAAGITVNISLSARLLLKLLEFFFAAYAFNLSLSPRRKTNAIIRLLLIYSMDLATIWE